MKASRDAQHRWRFVLCLGAAFALLSSTLGQVVAAPLDATASCAIAPTFAHLAALLGSATVGECVAAPYRDATQQATVQQTSRGLLTASETGAWTAFTDGNSTWVNGPAGLVKQPASSSRPATGSHGVHVLKRGGQRALSPARGRDQSQGPVEYLGGPVERTNATNYTIYWQPTGSFMDANFKALINRFFSDLHGTAFYGLLTQYYDTEGPIQNNSNLGGTWTDPSPYPSTISSECINASEFSNCLGDDDIQNEVQTAINVNSWPAGDNNNYFVFTASGEKSCDASGECSDTVYCAYHNSFGRDDIKYANMPYVADITGCDTGSYPNGDPAADMEINIASHETFETITDPDVGTGWVDENGQEIADKCLGLFGPLNGQGADVALNGDPYIVQQEWSNATNDCALSLPVELTVTLAGAGSGTISSSPAGISCPGTCSAAFSTGSVTLQASPASGSGFSGWTGACTGFGACALNLSGATNVTGTFGVCAPRPAVNVSAAAGGGQLHVTLSTAGASVSLQSIQFGPTSNGLIDIGNVVGSAGNLGVPMSPGTTSVSFTLRRAAAGATTAPLTVTDSCGTWPTFVGGGPTAF